MLEMLNVGDDKIIAYRLGGKITEEEMTSVLDIFREKIEFFYFHTVVKSMMFTDFRATIAA